MEQAKPPREIWEQFLHGWTGTELALEACLTEFYADVRNSFELALDELADELTRGNRDAILTTVDDYVGTHYLG